MHKFLMPVLLVLLFSSCKKTTVEQVKGDSFRISILPIKLENFDAYQINGTVDIRSVKEAAEYGIVYSKTINPTIESAKKIVLGKTNTVADFAYKLTGLDTGAAYYVKAYVAGSHSEVEYSANQAIGKISPTIAPVAMTLNFGRTFSAMLNLPRLAPGTPVKLFLNEYNISGLTYNTGTGGTFVTIPVPDNLQPGEYSLRVQVNNMSISYPKKITLFEGTWIQADNLPTENGGIGGFTDSFIDGDFIYSYSVYLNSTSTTTKAEFFRFNYKTKEKVMLKAFDPAYRLEKAGITKLNGKLHFVCGNWTGGLQNSFPTKYHYAYDIENNQWSREADFPGGERITPFCMSYGGKIYYGMGIKPGIINGPSQVYYTDMWSYDPTLKSWQRVADFPKPNGRYLYSSFQIGARGYLVSGVIGDIGLFGSAVATKEMWCFDANTGQWLSRADYPGKGQIWLTAFAIGNYGYAGLGESQTYDSYYGKNYDSQMFKYDPQSDKWTEVSSFGGGISHPFTGSNTTNAVVGGGYTNSGSSNNTLFVFKP